MSEPRTSNNRLAIVVGLASLTIVSIMTALVLSVIVQEFAAPPPYATVSESGRPVATASVDELATERDGAADELAAERDDVPVDDLPSVRLPFLPWLLAIVFGVLLTYAVIHAVRARLKQYRSSLRRTGDTGPVVLDSASYGEDLDNPETVSRG